MLALLSEFIRNVGHSITVIVMDREHMEQPQTFAIEPGRLLATLGLGLLAIVLLILSILLFTPLRYTLPGYGSLEMRREAVENQLRLEAVEDSLQIQTEYVTRLRDMFLGNMDDLPEKDAASSTLGAVSGAELMDLPLPTSSPDWEKHAQPAIAFNALDLSPPSENANRPVSGQYLSSLSFPVLPPITGLLTRGFDVQTGHFAVDIAADVGSPIRSIGDGYVILSDWLNDGGQVIAIAHAGGYISVFKHNSSLLKQAGERVRDREVIALSGNSGEITTGPHAHFELWQNGLAQDPRAYVFGW